VYCAYVLDVFSRCVLGWHCSTSLRTELALYKLEFGLWTRTRDGGDTSALAHHSYRAVQYFAVRYTERFVEAGAVGSVGSVGSRSDCDNALAEAFNSLCKAVLVRNQAPSRSIGELELAVAEYINWLWHTFRGRWLARVVMPG